MNSKPLSSGFSLHLRCSADIAEEMPLMPCLITHAAIKYLEYEWDILIPCGHQLHQKFLARFGCCNDFGNNLKQIVGKCLMEFSSWCENNLQIPSWWQQILTPFTLFFHKIKSFFFLWNIFSIQIAIWVFSKREHTKNQKAHTWNQQTNY